MGTVRDDPHTPAPPVASAAGPSPVRLPGQPHGTGHVSIRELCLHERQGACAGGLKLFREQSALPFGERAQHLGLADVVSAKELPAPCGAPTTLAHQQLPNRPRERRVGRVQDDFRGGSSSLSDPSLQLRAGQPDRIRSFQRSQSLRRRAHCGGLRHLVLRFLPFLRLGGSRFLRTGRGQLDPLPWVLYCALLFRTPRRSVCCSPPFPAFPTLPATCPARPSR